MRWTHSTGRAKDTGEDRIVLGLRCPSRGPPTVPLVTAFIACLCFDYRAYIRPIGKRISNGPQPAVHLALPRDHSLHPKTVHHMRWTHSTGGTNNVQRNTVSFITMFFRTKGVLLMNFMVSCEKGRRQRALPSVRWPKIDGADAVCETWHNPQTPVSSHESEAASHNLMGTPMVSSAVQILCVSAHTSAGTNPAIRAEDPGTMY